jgi:hypothetical protein
MNNKIKCDCGKKAIAFIDNKHLCPCCWNQRLNTINQSKKINSKASGLFKNDLNSPLTQQSLQNNSVVVEGLKINGVAMQGSWKVIKI